MQYGIQLYSVRDTLAKDYYGTLKAMADLGYKMVETITVPGVEASRVGEWCRELGLSVSGTHTGAHALTEENLENTIRDHQAMDCRLLIIPGHDLSTKEKIDEFVALVNRAQPELEKAGITLAYHNHSHEFYPNQDGQIIYHEILNRTKMKLELDTYWAFNAKKDPVFILDKLGERMIAIHLKDGDEQGHGYPLGMGCAPVKAVWEKAKEMGLPMIVESETLTPDGLTEAKICIEYLKQLEK
ncbi:MAG: sugar phosphate isomerase/epimerase [Clostridiales bacterium]|nr:sugar phosphate isomerase/epimerase [Clostridiales bacterium]